MSIYAVTTFYSDIQYSTPEDMSHGDAYQAFEECLNFVLDLNNTKVQTQTKNDDREVSEPNLIALQSEDLNALMEVTKLVETFLKNKRMGIVA